MALEYEMGRWKRGGPIYYRLAPEVLNRLYGHYSFLKNIHDMSVERDVLEKKDILLLIITLRAVKDILWFLDRIDNS